jgi:hypothetical protein
LEIKQRLPRQVADFSEERSHLALCLEIKLLRLRHKEAYSEVSRLRLLLKEAYSETSQLKLLPKLVVLEIHQLILVRVVLCLVINLLHQVKVVVFSVPQLQLRVAGFLANKSLPQEASLEVHQRKEVYSQTQTQTLSLEIHKVTFLRKMMPLKIKIVRQTMLRMQMNHQL